jgi:uncharacterized protein (TIGR02300 family)
MFSHGGPLSGKGFDSTLCIWQGTGIVEPTQQLFKGTHMPKEEWGVKRVCPVTGKRFYDLNKDPIVSPYTGEVVELDTGKSRMIAADGEDAATLKAKENTDSDDAVLEDDDDTVDVDLGDDVLDDDDEEDNVSLDEIADVSNPDDDS